jgi:hypothetical protein
LHVRSTGQQLGSVLAQRAVVPEEAGHLCAEPPEPDRQSIMVAIAVATCHLQRVVRQPRALASVCDSSTRLPPTITTALPARRRGERAGSAYGTSTVHEPWPARR